MRRIAGRSAPGSRSARHGEPAVGRGRISAGGRSSPSAGRARLPAADRHLVNAAVMLLTIRLEQSSATDAGLGMLRAALVRLVLSGQS